MEILKDVTIYITIYALTRGILKAKAETVDLNSKTAMVRGDDGTVFYFIGNEFYMDETSAIAEANLMKLKKIDSLEKKLDKMKKMTFSDKIKEF